MLRSALIAFPIAAAAGAGLLGLEKLGPFYKKSLAYQGALFALFFVLYLTIPGGFRENFNMPNDKTGKSWRDVLYFTAVTHSSTGYGDIYPLSPKARALVTMHAVLAFAGAANVLVFTA
jgi:hypothetical protein